MSVCREIESACVERKREFMYIYTECVCVERINDRESVWRDRDCEDIYREWVCRERKRDRKCVFREERESVCV